MDFQIKLPCAISPRLQPGVKIDQDWISIAYSERLGDGGRVRYSYAIDTHAEDGSSPSYENDDLQSGVGGESLQVGLQALLSFLLEASEQYRSFTDEDGDMDLPEHEDRLFPTWVCEWAYMCNEMLSAVRLELEETPDVIVESRKPVHP